MLFSTLAIYFQRLEQTPSRLKMTGILAELFKKASNDDIGMICYLLQGRVAPLYEATEFGIADKLMIRAIAAAFGVEEKKVLASYKKQGDLGIAAQEIADKTNKTNKTNVTIKQAFETLTCIAQMGGEGSQEKKVQILADLIISLDSLSVRYVVRIPLDKLRLGFSDMTILDGLSWMLVGNKSLHKQLEEAYNVRPDLAYIARSVKEKGIKGLSHVKPVVGAPILASLCARLPDAIEMIEKMKEVDVEPKYDGVRTQIHFKTWVRAFSRNLENTTAMYPELTHISKQINAKEVILDSEAVGYDEKHDRLIPFQETMTRKRKHDIENISRSVPLRFYVFDIMYKDGQDLMNTPLKKRREILNDVIKPGNFLFLSPNIITSDVNILRKYHDEQIKKGLEGVVVKKRESVYEPGRKGYHWVKFKEEDGKTGKLADTVDCMVMGYYRGEGKRSGFGIGAFLAGVKKGDQFVTISKVGTGATDELWKKLKTAFSRQSSRRRQGYGGQAAYRPKEYEEVNKALEPDVWINPAIVVEIAADDITVSPIHGAEFALRFPRLVRVRDDKSPREVTTVTELINMYHNQKHIR